MLTVWARLLGFEFLKTAIGKCVADVNNSNDDFEVDPNRHVIPLSSSFPFGLSRPLALSIVLHSNHFRAKEGTDLEANMERLQFQVNKFFQSILASVTTPLPLCPGFASPF